MHDKTVDLTTRCESCVFAEYTEKPPEQTGCALNRLDKLPNKKLDDNNFYIIEGTCNTCRDEAWEKRTLEKGLNLVNKVYEECEVQLDYVLVDDSINTPYEDILKTIKFSIRNMLMSIIKPKSIIVISSNKNISKNFTDFAVNDIEHIFKNTGVKFYACKDFEGSTIYERMIDIAVKQCKHTFYSVYKPGEFIPFDLISKLNQAINFDLVKAVVLKGRDCNSYNTVVHRKIHNLVGGNEGGYLLDKIEFLAKEQNLESMIKEWDDIS